MRRHRERSKSAKISLDRILEKPRLGRRPRIDPALVRSSADRFRTLIAGGWNELGESILAAQTEEDIADAFRRVLPNHHEFLRLSALILRARNERAFPKRKRAQIHFLADSIAGGGVVTLRRSRDICAEERAADAQRHMILRYEYWIECSCGYKGRSENHCCRKCGAVLYLPEASAARASQYY
jgi:hypothetical protein